VTAPSAAAFTGDNMNVSMPSGATGLAFPSSAIPTTIKLGVLLMPTRTFNGTDTKARSARRRKNADVVRTVSPKAATPVR
jgi:hypothetical protein